MYRMKKPAIWLIVIFLISAILFLIPFQKAVVFYFENTNHIEAYLPLDSGDTFQIIFTHSIHLTDVVEKYRITEDDLIEQYEIVYEEFGIGMPSNAEDGETFEYKDGKYYVKNLGNVFSSMNIRNGKTVSKHRLIWGKDEENQVWFNDYFTPGAWYKVKVENLSLWESMRGVKIHD